MKSRMRMTGEWTELDDAYLEIFGEHPALSAAASSVPTMDNQAATAEQPALDERDMAMLELERSWWKYPRAKDGTIRAKFELSPTQYYAALNRLIDRPEALEADPMLVKRLRRLREARRQQRSGLRARV